MCSLFRTVSTKACPPWEATSAGAEIAGMSQLREKAAVGTAEGSPVSCFKLLGALSRVTS